MDVQAISGAATIAMVFTLAFFAIAGLRAVTARLLPTQRFFQNAIMRESADRFRSRLQQTERAQRTYLFSLILFALLFAAAYWLNAGSLYESYPEWQLWLLLAAVVGSGLFVLYRIIACFIAWRRLSFERDAVIAIGHGLSRMPVENGHLFHDVETPVGAIDHVLVGVKGVYGVHVVARRPGRDASVEALAGKLEFSDSEDAVSVSDMRRCNSALSRQLSALCETRINVRLVVGLPGWDSIQQGDDSLLIVNERTLPMIKGWRDTHEFLLNDVIETINRHIAQTSRIGK